MVRVAKLVIKFQQNGKQQQYVLTSVENNSNPETSFLPRGNGLRTIQVFYPFAWLVLSWFAAFKRGKSDPIMFVYRPRESPRRRRDVCGCFFSPKLETQREMPANFFDRSLQDLFWLWQHSDSFAKEFVWPQVSFLFLALFWLNAL